LATAFTFSSQGCSSTFGMLFVSLTNRAAFTISNGYTDAGRITLINESGCSAIGITSFSSSDAGSFGGAEGGGAGVEGGWAAVTAGAAAGGLAELVAGVMGAGGAGVGATNTGGG